MTEAAPPDPGAAAEKKRPLLRRVPTSLVVTLVGIALTAWLLPAFTRQWDDRQKAHELKATIVADMASSTAGALSEAHDILVRSSDQDLGLLKGRLPPTLKDASWQVTPAAEKEWVRESIRIEAELRAYFGGRQANEWRGYRHVVDRFLAHAAGRLVSAQAESRPARLPANLSRLNDDIWDLANRRTIVVGQLQSNLVRDNPVLANRLVQLTVLASFVEEGLLTYEEGLSREVLASHVDGFSTTTHDLFNNLVP